MPLRNIPAVSIVIPMYNAEKYIGECLDSIFAQTFQDFEVIVVDDCSTDNSCTIVENYSSTLHRGGVDKLKLIRCKINYGSAGTPRSIGINLSRGEYVGFVDADDVITKTALEELYSIAKKFDADVVHCEKYYAASENLQVTGIIGLGAEKFVTEPTLLSDDFKDRVIRLCHFQFTWNVWAKLIRRDFILANDIRTIDGMAEDVLITCCLVCSAKRYVVVPNIVNFYRVVESSVSRKKLDIPKQIHRHIKALTDGFNYLENFLDRQEFFLKNLDAKHLVLEVWVYVHCQYLFKIYEQIPAWQLDEIVRHEFEQCRADFNLMAFIFSRMNVFNLQINRQNQIIRQLKAQLQK